MKTIGQMETGRELDERIAIDVMGLKYVERIQKHDKAGNELSEYADLSAWVGEYGRIASMVTPPKYSTDIKQAFKILEKMRPLCSINITQLNYSDDDDDWHVSFEKFAEEVYADYIHKSLCVAICKASLRCLEAQNESLLRMGK